MSTVIEINKSNFESLVNESKILMIDFWAPWCGPCRNFAPVYQDFASKNPDIVFAKLNTDEEHEIAASFGIQSIPTVGIFKDKDLVFLEPGMLPEEALTDLSNQVRNLDMEKVRKENQKS
jgi:thioredoxin 1